MSLESAIVPILVASGAITAGAGLLAVGALRPFLRLAFDIGQPDAPTVFFARHWGVLIFAIGALIVWSAYIPDARTPILAAAILEKAAIVLLIFLGTMKRTAAMTAIAVVDLSLAAIYAAYLAGTRT